MAIFKLGLVVLPLLVAVAGAGAGKLTTPSPFQLRHQLWGQETFIHFSITTYTSSQAGDQDPAAFAPDPKLLNVSQWVAVAKSMGSPVAVLTAKHEAGFCIWPSRHSNYTIAHSSTVPDRDLVREFVDACRAQGVLPGLYFTFGAHEHGPGATAVQVAQMEELATQYGDIHYWWFDHHSNDPGHVAIDDLVRKHLPNAVMLGPDSWVTGDESGAADYPLWYAVNTTDGTDHARPNMTLAPHDEGGFPYGLQFKSWESSCSFFEGCHPWFCCGTVPTPAQAMRLYEATWGRGANLILNTPPSKSGLIEPQLVAAAAAFGRSRAQLYGTPLAATKATADQPIVLDLPAASTTPVSRVLLAEETLATVGQLVASYTLEAFDGSAWTALGLGPDVCPTGKQGQCGGKTIGARHVDVFDPPLAPASATKLRVTVTGNACPTCPSPVLSFSAF